MAFAHYERTDDEWEIVRIATDPDIEDDLPLTRHLLGQMGFPVDGGLVRVSFGGSTSGWEVERLGHALRTVAAGLPQATVRYSDTAG